MHLDVTDQQEIVTAHVFLVSMETIVQRNVQQYANSQWDVRKNPAHAHPAQIIHLVRCVISNVRLPVYMDVITMAHVLDVRATHMADTAI